MPESEQGHDAEIKTSFVRAKREAVVVIRPPAHLRTLHSPRFTNEFGGGTVVPGQNRPAANVADGGHYDTPESNKENGEHDQEILIDPQLHSDGIVLGTGLSSESPIRLTIQKHDFGEFPNGAGAVRTGK